MKRVWEMGKKRKIRPQPRHIPTQGTSNVEELEIVNQNGVDMQEGKLFLCRLSLRKKNQPLLIVHTPMVAPTNEELATALSQTPLTPPGEQPAAATFYTSAPGPVKELLDRREIEGRLEYLARMDENSEPIWVQMDSLPAGLIRTYNSLVRR